MVLCYRAKPCRNAGLLFLGGRDMPDTKSDCEYYNWNDNPDYPSYPKEYGARCERLKIFFRMTNGRLLPDCRECRWYEKRK